MLGSLTTREVGVPPCEWDARVLLPGDTLRLR
jgi:hypothetical protein